MTHVFKTQIAVKISYLKLYENFGNLVDIQIDEILSWVSLIAETMMIALWS